MSRRPLLILLLVYGVFSLVTLGIWTARIAVDATGDEPHYLVMVNAIVRHGTFEQTAAYGEEYATREIYPPGLDQPGAIPKMPFAMVESGPHGLYNIHNIGIPLLVALPYTIGGLLGAKVFMILLGGLVIVVCWNISGCFSNDKRQRFWIVMSAAVGMPLIPAANQIYPDIPAGLISLTGLYWLLTIDRPRPLRDRLFLACAIAYLPWLQIKFAAPCIILVVALSLASFRTFKVRKQVLEIAIPTFASFVLLAFYNWYAFGNFFGPYSEESLQVSRYSLMVLIGLHIDQNQGLFFMNPIFVAGLIGVGSFFKTYRQLSIVTLLVFLSLIVPNGLHPNWYGGSSLSGRFGWSAAIVFMLPTIFFLTKIAKVAPRVFAIIISLGFVMQIVLFVRYALMSVSLYNRSLFNRPLPPASQYSIHFGRFYWLLPELFDRTVAYHNGVNYVAVIFMLVLLGIGFLSRDVAYRHRYAILGALSAAVLANFYFAFQLPH